MMTCRFKLTKQQLDIISFLEADIYIEFNGKNSITFLNHIPVPISITFFTHVDNPELSSSFSLHKSFWERLKYVDKEIEIEITEKQVKGKSSNINIKSSLFVDVCNGLDFPESSDFLAEISLSETTAINDIASKIFSIGEEAKFLIFNENMVYLCSTQVIAAKSTINMPLQIIDYACFKKAFDIASSMKSNLQILKSGEQIWFYSKSLDHRFYMNSLRIDVTKIPIESIIELMDKAIDMLPGNQTFAQLDSVELNSTLSIYKRNERLAFVLASYEAFFENIGEEQKCTSKIGCIQVGKTFVLGFTRQNLVIPKSKEVRIDYFNAKQPFVIRPFPFRGEIYVIAPLALDDSEIKLETF